MRRRTVVIWAIAAAAGAIGLIDGSGSPSTASSGQTATTKGGRSATVGGGGTAAVASRTLGPGLRRLALMMLPRGALGPRFSRFRVDPTSGPVSNARSAMDSLVVGDSAARLAAAGRTGGYRLVYEREPQGVIFEVERFRSAAQAQARFPKEAAVFPAAGFARVRVGVIGDEAAGFRARVVVLGRRFQDTTVGFRQGALIASVDLVEGAGAANGPRAVGLARSLSRRIAAVLAGQVRGSPVPVPPPLPLGPPAGGPDLAGIALRPPDLPAGATVAQQHYVRPTVPGVLAEYDSEFSGQFVLGGSVVGAVSSDVILAPNAPAAALTLAVLRTRVGLRALAVVFRAGGFSDVHAGRLPTPGLGDAVGFQVRGRVGGRPVGVISYIIRVGRVTGVLSVGMAGPPRPGAAFPLAQTMYTRMQAAVTG